jgi:hypothetical protein
MKRVKVKTFVTVDNPHFTEKRDKSEMFDHPFIKGRRVTNYQRTFQKPVEFEAYFHQWGLCAEEGDSGFASYTVAIVQDYDGIVFTAEPSGVTFLKTEEQEIENMTIKDMIKNHTGEKLPKDKKSLYKILSKYRNSCNELYLIFKEIEGVVHNLRDSDRQKREKLVLIIDHKAFKYR